jgi:L-asparaginase
VKSFVILGKVLSLQNALGEKMKMLPASILLCALLAVPQAPGPSVLAQNTDNRGGRSLPLVGALVVMNGQINAAREVSKTNTTEMETFKSLEFGELGVVDPERVRFYRAPLRRQTITLGAEARLGRVEIIVHYAGADGRLIRALLNDNAQPDSRLNGLVIAGVGLGHVSGAMYDAIKEARDRNIPVVISTRVYTGRTIPLYANKGRGISLKDIGCVFADNLSPQKARILLMLALTKPATTDELQRYFDH